MTSLSTHDTKRGEDVRARLAVLSELPDDWGRFAEHFLEFDDDPQSGLRLLPGSEPGRNWSDRTPADAPLRREGDAGGVRRNQLDGTGRCLRNLGARRCRAAYDEPQLRAAWNELDALITGPGWSNALGQKLVQLTMPGVPDVFQGSEIWENSLVDPDNRRPVDFAARMALLGRVSDGRPTVDDTGIAKLWITRQALRIRREHPDWFRSYQPLEASAQNAITWWASTEAARSPSPPGCRSAGRGRQLGDTRLSLRRPMLTNSPDGAHRATCCLAELLADYPVALLTPRLRRVLLQDEGDEQVDSVTADLAVVDLDRLLFDPR